MKPGVSQFRVAKVLLSVTSDVFFLNDLIGKTQIFHKKKKNQGTKCSRNFCVLF
jgi:hypothetical protein